MHFHFFVLTILAMVTYVKCSKANIHALDTLLASLGGVGGDSSSSSDENGSMNTDEVSKEMQKYMKEMAMKEQHEYKKLMKYQISKEEKDEVKYFKDMLEKIKLLNRD